MCLHSPDTPCIIVSMKNRSLSSYALLALYSAFLILILGVDTASAQAVSSYSLQGYLIAILRFINIVLIPFLFSIALLFFLVNAARYFIIKGDDDGERAKAKSLALYGIGAFVILVSFWGIINMFVSGLGFDEDAPICPDYLQGWCYSNYGSDPFDSYNSNSGYFDDPGCYYVNGEQVCG